MAQRIRALRGFPDIGPEDTPGWRQLEDACAQVLDRYAFEQIRLPILEATELFARSVGEATDIVEKEMFSFVDRERHSMSLRPEGTASAVRLGIDLGLLHNAQRRLWYIGPMFRHERPQAGRYRQFHQIGVECFGIAGPLADIEVIALSEQLLQSAGVRSAVQLEINTLGSQAARAEYRGALQSWLQERFDDLDADSQSRVERNPLRVLDSKVPQTQALLVDAPKLVDYLDEDSLAHHRAVLDGLEALGIDYVENPRLVRGLDYYNHCVFEWTTTELGAQGTVLAGGRYDGLVEQLGGGPVPACGFAMGLERVLLLQKALDVAPVQRQLDIYICHEGVLAQPRALTMAQDLRALGAKVCIDGATGRLKPQLKRAAQSGAAMRVVIKDQTADWSVLESEPAPALREYFAKQGVAGPPAA
nr:histidine--tRNA ligase [Oceanococcus sp. HetDA_MAG_MS8]